MCTCCTRVKIDQKKGCENDIVVFVGRWWLQLPAGSPPIEGSFISIPWIDNKETLSRCFGRRRLWRSPSFGAGAAQEAVHAATTTYRTNGILKIFK